MKLNETIAQTWSVLQKHWKGFREARRQLDPDKPGTELTNQNWLLPLFEELKYGRLTTARSPEIDGRTYPIERFYAGQPIHLIGCNLPLDRRTTGARGAATASPHSMVQEYLNRGENSLWGFLSNGLVLRILRDNVSLSRQAYVEFNLEAMMDGEVYADFALLWMLCHQSRVEAEKPQDCWLEKWSQLARDLGTRVLSDLRQGVTKAIEALGSGFIAHPRNDSLREKLRSGQLSTQDYYRQLLRVVYRLLFLFVAEDRELLHPPGADEKACQLYDAYYSTRHLRELADRLRGSKHADLWQALSIVFDALGRPAGCPELGLAPLGSFLWRHSSTQDLLAPQTPTRSASEAESGSSLALFDIGSRPHPACLDGEEDGGLVAYGRDNPRPHPPRADGEGDFGSAQRADNLIHHPGELDGVSPDALAAHSSPPSYSPSAQGGWGPKRAASKPRTPPLGEPSLIANDDLLSAVRALAYVEQDKVRRGVDYRNLGSEELGSVYESLLELHPIVNVPARTFELSVAAGNERKTTGSYYTPDSLVQCLLDSALDPVVEDRLQGKTGAAAEAALLDLKVCDPACGSGHFLIAAAHRLARRLARVRTGESEPSPADYQHALRDVIGRCVYGVDINPMAVELCKVSLWMEALEPGRPLSFLDHHIQCGNALLGATPTLLAKGIPDEAFTPIEGDDKKLCAAFKKLNRDERRGQKQLFADVGPWDRLGDFAVGLARLDVMSDDTPAALREKEDRYGELVRSADYLSGRFWADSWCAAFVWKKTKEFDYPITEDVFRSIERNPHSASPWLRAEVERLARQYQFFHWHLAFPSVFRVLARGVEAENEHCGWNGGFDVLLGNPPWERTKHDEAEWFAGRNDAIAEAPTTAIRRSLITELAASDPALCNDFRNSRRDFEATCSLIRETGRYKYGASGEANLAIIFAENAIWCIGPLGRVGMVLPTTIVTDKSAQPLCRFLVDSGRLTSVWDFENRNAIFPSVHRSYKFCLLTALGSSTESDAIEAVFFASDPFEINDRRQRISLKREDIRRLNPNTFSFPVIRSKRDSELLIQVYRRINALLLDTEADGGAWGYSVSFLFEMNRASHLFNTERTAGHLPLLEAKLVHQFNDRGASFGGQSTRDREAGNTRAMHLQELLDPSAGAEPRYWVPTDAVIDAFARSNIDKNYAVVIREITNSTNERTIIACVIPKVGMGHTCWTVRLAKANALEIACFVANLSSIVLDYIARQKVGRTHMSNFIIKQLPVLPPKEYGEQARWHVQQSLGRWLLSRVLELTFTWRDLDPFARDCGYDGPPFRWDEERRFLLRCELDAAFFHLYGIERDDVDYILETFPIVKRKDLARTEVKDASGKVIRPGTFITKDTILAIYDQLAAAIASGRPYQTHLDPPPGPPADAAGNFLPLADWHKAHWPRHIHPPRAERAAP